MDEAAIYRLIERHGTAAVRALSRSPDAIYRRQGLFVDGRRLALQSPYLFADPVGHSLARNRGVVDALAMRLLHSDRNAHRRRRPDTPIEQLVFDMLEQLRCESLADGRMDGLIRNMDQSFSTWCIEFRASGLAETELGLMIHALAHMVRSRLMSRAPGEEIEGLIESVRFRLVPLIGCDLAGLKQCRHDQGAYADHALSIAGTILDVLRRSGLDVIDREIAALREKSLLPPESVDDDSLDEVAADNPVLRDFGPPDEGYRAFCTDFDRTVAGEDLYRLAQRLELRERLDRLIAAQSVNIPRLAQRLKIVFGAPRRSGWNEGVDDGHVDGRRISQLIANPGYTRIFKQEKRVPQSDAVVTFLIDNSGSMRRQKYEALAVLVDVLCRALDMAGVGTEILGFTTGGWAGGESIKVWRRHGSPDHPGRLNDRLHIVYKGADSDWKRSRLAIASMLNPAHFREGLDGEALEWALVRLLRRPESRKCLVFVSDGAPMETATCNHNHPAYLDNHLRNVVDFIERSGAVELRAIATALNLDDFLSHWTAVDLSGTLDSRTFHVLERIFQGRHHDHSVY
ncbi:MAG: cobalt chelatase [Gammaproteobacteria bacterium]|nr:cobalt chelatase [Gammaproteobacteria bacterium]MYD75927.1 cobalt chelatase [Gammaproteobacteria bacterium]MYJ52718.1 cobalt chelatase [Gammaproteobacteria bacterium]